MKVFHMLTDCRTSTFEFVICTVRGVPDGNENGLQICNLYARFVSGAYSDFKGISKPIMYSPAEEWELGDNYIQGRIQGGQLGGA